ncbi:MAG: hypothetical protein IJ050_00595 [Clostridia bacterium]|nr:hypothetical protein [Clostridia bacterium]
MGKCNNPVIFVTGIGQTWASLKGSDDYCWNLIPRKKEIAFKDFNLKMYFSLAGTLLRGLLTLVSSANFIKTKTVRDLFSALLSCCVVDESDSLPENVSLKIYGSRSFDKLRHINLLTGEYCDEYEKSMLCRIYRDIPCKSISEKIGGENLYCFNYSPFSDIYADADALHETIKDVLEDQKNKTGSKKVVLVPMSMGASVVNAYIDKYYSDETGALDGDYIIKIVSIVGAWNGSVGLSDLITFNTGENFAQQIKGFFGEKYSSVLSRVKEKQIEKVFGSLIDGVVHSVILRNTSFMALVPKERYNEVIEKLFNNTNNKKLLDVKEKSAVYYRAQCNLVNKLLTLRDKCSVGVYFICGYNKHFGQNSRDFDFLSLFKSAKSVNSDSVIQVTSTAPGARSVPLGEAFEKEGRYISPDRSVDVSQSPFRDTIWLFDGQYHEIGSNNTAIKLAGDIVTGEVESIDDKYPQFNRARDVSGAGELLEKAKIICESRKVAAAKKEAVKNAARNVELMLDSVINNPEKDSAVLQALKDEISTVLI